MCGLWGIIVGTIAAADDTLVCLARKDVCHREF